MLARHLRAIIYRRVGYCTWVVSSVSASDGIFGEEQVVMRSSGRPQNAVDASRKKKSVGSNPIRLRPRMPNIIARSSSVSL
jgi:hypothetical protein